MKNKSTNKPPICPADDLLKVCQNTYNVLQHIYKMLNYIASGEQLNEWSRVDPQAVLGEIYGLLATPFYELKEIIEKIETNDK